MQKHLLVINPWEMKEQRAGVRRRKSSDDRGPTKLRQPHGELYSTFSNNVLHSPKMATPLDFHLYQAFGVCCPGKLRPWAKELLWLKQTLEELAAGASLMTDEATSPPERITENPTGRQNFEWHIWLFTFPWRIYNLSEGSSFWDDKIGRLVSKSFDEAWMNLL